MTVSEVKRWWQRVSRGFSASVQVKGCSPERRQAARCACVLDVDCRPVAPETGTPQRCTMHDLSTAGAAVITTIPFSMGTLLEVEIKNAARSILCKRLLLVVHGRAFGDRALVGRRPLLHRAEPYRVASSLRIVSFDWWHVSVAASRTSSMAGAGVGAYSVRGAFPRGLHRQVVAVVCRAKHGIWNIWRLNFREV